MAGTEHQRSTRSAGSDGTRLKQQNFSQSLDFLFQRETIFHKVFLIGPFVLLTIELAVRTLDHGPLRGVSWPFR